MKSTWISTLLILAITAMGAYVVYRYLSADDESSQSDSPAPVVTQNEGKGKIPTNATDTAKDPAKNAEEKNPSPVDEKDEKKDEEKKPEQEEIVEEQKEPLVIPQRWVAGKKGADQLAELLLQASSPLDRKIAVEQLSKARLLHSDAVNEQLMRAFLQLDLGYDNSPAKLSHVGTYIHGEADVHRYKIVDGESNEVYIDLLATKDPERPWVVMTARAAAKGMLKGPGDAPSIHVVEQFVRAVSQGNMLAARELISGKGVSDATVAGLCMVFAEGGYKLRESAPLRASFENEDRAGYLVYLLGERAPQNVFVGIELAKLPEKGWRIDAVAMDSLLEGYEQSAGEEGGRYFPIVKIPQGGDSLVLFFAFDDSALTPRSLRQLKIVAELLKESQRKLDISGHTDDVGSESYNKELSLKRAASVMKALIDFGVSPGQITMKGMGKSQPRRHYSNEELTEQQIEAMRAENRRAEIYLDFQ